MTMYCLVSAVGADCTNADSECDVVNNSECGSSDTCVCKTGYVGSIGDDVCTAGKRV